MRFLVLALSAAVAHPLHGSGVETQHAFDVTLPLKPRLEIIFHSRVRTQPGGLGFYQVRAGPALSWNVAREFLSWGATTILSRSVRSTTTSSAATEPAGSEGSSQNPHTETDPATGEQ